MCKLYACRYRSLMTTSVRGSARAFFTFLHEWTSVSSLALSKLASVHVRLHSLEPHTRR